MDRVALGWVVLEMTNSAWDLAVLEAIRWMPLLLFGIVGGAAADRIDRRWVLIGAQTLALLKRMPLATRPQRPGTGPMLRYLVEGFASLRYSQPIVGVLLVSVFMNVLVFPYQQVLPVFARDQLGVDAVGLGALSAAAGVGSVLGAGAIASTRRIPRSGMLFWTGSCLMGISLAGFALAGSLGMALVLLVFTGLGQAAFSSLQATIVLGASSDQLRGRAMGALTLSIGTTPFGSLEMGALSVALGASPAVALNAIACAVLIAVVAARLPRFRSV